MVSLKPNEIEAANRAEATALLMRSGYRADPLEKPVRAVDCHAPPFASRAGRPVGSGRSPFELNRSVTRHFSRYCPVSVTRLAATRSGLDVVIEWYR